ncbi:glycosyltransferase [Listeria booriae]|uniref:Glycosyltransferase n=1 Tax=Listeria booriae TaxID=1552123 RepID=A0A7X1CEN7_9LIST|nr:glycosyltransferase [Listeria booriae]MBC1561552.1 glycosyltransferase [Listeria booriae]MBC1574019.1 glycosyltransferase [Listeria booriae]MBC2321743.1 glycosyltransferase [Listeria booriae]MCD2205766.1 glycosyltransferase family 4 protein [Listeria booriae]
MKTIFAHDHRFYRSPDNREILSKNAFGVSMWKRYLEFTDELRVVARVFDFPRDATREKMALSSSDDVTFQHMDGTHSWKSILPKNNTQKQMEQQVADVDAVIARLPSRIGSMAVKAARKQDKPYMVEVVGDPVESYHYHGSKILKLMASYAGKKMKNDIAGASHVLYVTKEDLQLKYPTKGEQAAASNVEIEMIDLAVYEKRKQKIKKRATQEMMKIGMIGTLATNYKGIDTAIDAVRELKKQNRAVHLYIIGPGDTTKWSELAKKAGVIEEVTFCGILPGGQEILDWLDTMDIYIQPSKTEGVPRALIEAMSRGCPAVGSEAGGIPELLSNHMLHAIGDSKELANRIAYLDSKEIQWEESWRNIQKASDYTKPVLQKRRSALYRSFFQTIKYRGMK